MCVLFSRLICWFRDQNFGLNELAAIQDVRNDYNLQDITDEPPSSAQTTNDRGKFVFLKSSIDCLYKIAISSPI